MGSRGENEDLQTALVTVPSLAVAAHELKAPLSLLRQMSLMLRDMNPESLLSDAAVRELLERTTLTSERSLRLVEMVTKHARLEDGLFELEPVHVGRVCEEVAHELTPLSKALRRDIQVKVSRRPALAVANRDLLRSIILGLCDNALAYGDEDQPIIMSTQQTESHIRASVRDYGPKLSADAFQKLEQRLGRAAQPIGQRPNSSGLGLYVAGQFASAMQGQLGALRHRGKGTTFYVDTPASAQLSFLSV